MRSLKNYIPIYIIMVCCFIALSGCGGASYSGKDIVDRAKQLHTELEAANVIVTDEISGTVVQEITYRFAGDVMQYMYIGRDAETGEEYYEFNNGTELDTWHTGDTAWSFAAKGSEGYYNYSRVKRHYFADGALLLNDYSSAVNIAIASVIDEQDGAKVVTLLYDDSKISQYEQMQGVTDYRQEYRIGGAGSEGRCMFYSVEYTKDGKQYSYAVRINSSDPSVQIQRAEPPELTDNTEKTQ